MAQEIKIFGDPTKTYKVIVRNYLDITVHYPAGTPFPAYEAWNTGSRGYASYTIALTAGPGIGNYMFYGNFPAGSPEGTYKLEIYADDVWDGYEPFEWDGTQEVYGVNSVVRDMVITPNE